MAALRKFGLTVLLSCALYGSLSLGAVASVHAQERVDAVPKGTIGLGLIGAEIGFVVPALAGLHEPWAFIVFPIVGAAGGAVGGYFGIDDPGYEEASVAVLAASMALIIPTVVITLMATRYDPEDDESTEPGNAAVQLAQARRQALQDGLGLVRLGKKGLRLDMPGVHVQLAYTRQELRQYQVEQQPELHVPIFSGSF